MQTRKYVPAHESDRPTSIYDNEFIDNRHIFRQDEYQRSTHPQNPNNGLARIPSWYSQLYPMSSYIYLPTPTTKTRAGPTTHTSSKNCIHCNNYVIAHLLLPAKQPNLAFPSSLVPYRSAPDTVCPPRTLLGLSWTRCNCVYLPDMYVLACNLPDIYLRA
jgi:hypothetical protein